MEEIFMIKDPIKQYDDVRKTSTGQGDDYTIRYQIWVILKKITD